MTTDADREDACDYCDRCLWGCPRDAIYNPGLHTLKTCETYEGFQYRSGRFVISLECHDDKVTGIRVCRQGRRDTAIQIIEGQDPGGRAYLWLGDFLSDETSQADTDLAAIMEGAIAVTPLHLDLTHKATLKRLAGVFP